jgi:hypothetical protein
MLSWGKKDQGKGEKWEAGVIGREKARIILDSGRR